MFNFWPAWLHKKGKNHKLIFENISQIMGQIMTSDINEFIIISTYGFLTSCNPPQAQALVWYNKKPSFFTQIPKLPVLTRFWNWFWPPELLLPWEAIKPCYLGKNKSRQKCVMLNLKTISPGKFFFRAA